LSRVWRCLFASLALASAPAQALDPATLGVVINSADPDSVAVGEYFVQRRAIPAANVVRVAFPPGQSVMSPVDFTTAAAQLSEAMPAGVQALALAWTQPYRVGCMSVTAAFAFGYDSQYCADGCRPTPRSLYFDSDSKRPFDELRMRPAMLLAGSSTGQAQRTIDSGVAADEGPLRGAAYLMRTSETGRGVRVVGYPAALRLARPGFRVEIRDADALEGARDVLFYFTGVARVAGLSTLKFRPGAIADHLTSNGGILIDSPQMSSLAWLDAGATGSYGTVVEPCSFPQKFPQPAIVMRRYLAGETLIESYWKSVAMPAQGVFIGEPLARIALH
jgi:uncharacterized protein (TIGR03790 family)